MQRADLARCPHPIRLAHMKKLLLVVVLVALALVAYVAAGPYLTLRAMGRAIEARDSSALSKHVDFPAVQASLRAQVEDAIARRIGASRQDSIWEGLGLQVANTLAGGAVEAIATPAGLAALMQSGEVWDRLGALTGANPDAGPRGSASPALTRDGAPPPAVSTPAPSASAQSGPSHPLANAQHRYESSSRFVAVVQDSQGRPITLVLTRHGLTWKLSDIRLQP